MKGSVGWRRAGMFDTKQTVALSQHPDNFWNTVTLATKLIAPIDKQTHERFGDSIMGTSSFPQEQTADNDQLATRVRNLVAEQLEVATERVTDEARFDDLGADWLDHIELM